MRFQLVFSHRLPEVVENMGRVGNRLRMGPGLEFIPQGIHVGVRADAGVAEQVPGATQRRAPLHDEVAPAGAALLQMAGRADPGNSRTDDQYVEVLICHGLPPLE